MTLSKYKACLVPAGGLQNERAVLGTEGEGSGNRPGGVGGAGGVQPVL